MQSYGWQELQIILQGGLPIEKTLPLEVLVCPNCGKIDLFAADETRKVLAMGQIKPVVRICRVCKHEVGYYEKCPYCGDMPKDERMPVF